MCLNVAAVGAGLLHVMPRPKRDIPILNQKQQKWPSKLIAVIIPRDYIE